MTEVTLASLAMDFDVRSAEPATQKTDALRAASRALEEQARATSQAVRDHAVAQGLSGTAAGRVEQSLRPVIAAYGQARDELGRFAREDGNYRLSQDATVLTVRCEQTSGIVFGAMFGLGRGVHQSARSSARAPLS